MSRRVSIYELENVVNAVYAADGDEGLIYSLRSDYPITLLMDARNRLVYANHRTVEDMAAIKARGTHDKQNIENALDRNASKTNNCI